jgi:hypothetical protein
VTPTSVKEEDNIMGYLWDCLNGVEGVPIEPYSEVEPPKHLNVLNNWCTGKHTI